MIPKNKPLRDKKYMKSHEHNRCVFTGCLPCVGHHLKFPKLGGMGMKPPDDYTIPVTHAIHQEIHSQGEMRTFRKYMYWLEGAEQQDDKIKAWVLIQAREHYKKYLQGVYGREGHTKMDTDFYDQDEPYPDCQRCSNTGFILVCPDDMCRGLGECIHGDGEILCPDCKGESAL